MTLENMIESIEEEISDLKRHICNMAQKRQELRDLGGKVLDSSECVESMTIEQMIDEGEQLQQKRDVLVATKKKIKKLEQENRQLRFRRFEQHDTVTVRTPTRDLEIPF